jgi:predicted AlkP superfamily phosphohydrolase/phosphomutase
LVLGIDGVPRTLLFDMLKKGILPALKMLVGDSTLHEQKSVLPTVSSAAWTSFMTGLHPPRHRIMGFVNKKRTSYDISFPRREQIEGELLPELVSNQRGRVFSMGVPVTYPPMPVNGMVISCFLAPSLEKAVWPPRELSTLQRIGYSIDPDPTVAHQDRTRFMRLVVESLKQRIETIKHYLPQERWDLFLAHCMETDRLHHFFWSDYEDPSAPFHEQFHDFYRVLDGLFDWIGNEMGSRDRIIILSDHGFSRLDYEVNLGKWLVDKDLTSLQNLSPGPPLANIAWQRTKVYSLLPGRIYLNIRGREPEGIIDSSIRERFVRELKDEFLAWRGPKNEQVISTVLVDEEIPGFSERSECPDLLLVPANGMDLKDGALRPHIFEKKALNGMHTFDNAVLFLGGRQLPTGRRPWIGDLAPTILKLLEFPIPVGLDGDALV